jgi:hypothetical protein
MFRLSVGGRFQLLTSPALITRTPISFYRMLPLPFGRATVEGGCKTALGGPIKRDQLTDMVAVHFRSDSAGTQIAGHQRILQEFRATHR